VSLIERTSTSHAEVQLLEAVTGANESASQTRLTGARTTTRDESLRLSARAGKGEQAAKRRGTDRSTQMEEQDLVPVLPFRNS
jgi:hypothetical protein